MDKAKKFAPIGAAVLGLIAVVMIFVAAIAVKDGGDTYTGLQVVFGYKEEFMGRSYGVFDFSFVNLLPYLFAIGGIACSVLAFMKEDNKLFSLVAVACFVLAAIFFFLPIAGLQLAGAENASKEMIKEAKSFFELGAGAIVAAICSILAAVCSAVPVVLK